MAKSVVSIRLNETELEALDRLPGASERGRSKVIEAIIQEYLARSHFEVRSPLRAALKADARAEAPEPKRWATYGRLP